MNILYINGKKEPLVLNELFQIHRSRAGEGFSRPSMAISNNDVCNIQGLHHPIQMTQSCSQGWLASAANGLLIT